MFNLGIIDSGVGGISFVNKLLDHNLEVNIYYLNDQKNVPWGNKDDEFILKRISLMTEVLLKNKVEAILIACNTATTKTIVRLRELYKIPFIGVEPYVNFVNHDKEIEKHNIALISTVATYNSKRFKDLIAKYDKDSKITSYPLENLASYIERLPNESHALIELLQNELSPLKGKGFTHLILGCTHYSLISNFIKTYLNVTIVDPIEIIIEKLIHDFSLKKSTNLTTTFYYSKNLEEDFNRVNISQFEKLFI